MQLIQATFSKKEAKIVLAKKMQKIIKIYHLYQIQFMIAKQEQDRKHESELTVIRLALLLMQLAILLNNCSDQTSYIARYFPSMTINSEELRETQRNFQAANTMALVFVAMQLIILYVGTNRHRIFHTIFVSIVHILGTIMYGVGGKWQLQNMWVMFHMFSFVPLCSEIAVALYTAKI